MKSDNILGPSASLLGVALLIVTVVHISGHGSRSIADEVAFAAAMMFIGSCIAAHIAIGRNDKRLDTIADRLFFLGLVTLLFAALTFWF